MYKFGRIYESCLLDILNVFTTLYPEADEHRSLEEVPWFRIIYGDGFGDWPADSLVT